MFEDRAKDGSYHFSWELDDFRWVAWIHIFRSSSIESLGLRVDEVLE